MNSDSKTIRELIANLSDGALSVEDAVRLNELLKGDEIAQQMYLDHVIIDGLLEREFQGTVSTSTTTSAAGELVNKEELSQHTQSVLQVNGSGFAYPRSAIFATAASVLCVAFIAGVWSFRTPVASKVNESVKLALPNASFESGTPSDSIVTSDGVWIGDAVQVAGSVSHVTPFEGSHMLRFDDLDEMKRNSSAIYQLVDLRGWDQKLAKSDIAVKASAHFNAAADDEDDSRLFSIKLYAFEEKPEYVPGVEPLDWGKALVFSGSQFVADADEASWQDAVAHLNLTPEAKYLVIELSVSESDVKSEPADESTDYFVDKVGLRLVTSTILE